MTRPVIAVTGGVAAGKSEVTQRFEALGIVIADADVIARTIVEPGKPALAAIVKRFGSDLLDDRGRLQRRILRERIFANAQDKRDLEAIMHPGIREGLREQAQAAPGPYVLVSIPLLAEVGARIAYPWVSRVLVVDVPQRVQLSRLLQRDGISDDLAQRMISAQTSRETRLSLANDVLINDSSIQALAASVDRLDAFYRQLSGRA